MTDIRFNSCEPYDPKADSDGGPGDEHCDVCGWPCDTETCTTCGQKHACKCDEVRDDSECDIE